MTSLNLASQPARERAEIELDKQAALAIYQLRKGQITRRHIEVMLYDMPEQDAGYFKDRLNHHRNAHLKPENQEFIA